MQQLSALTAQLQALSSAAKRQLTDHAVAFDGQAVFSWGELLATFVQLSKQAASECKGDADAARLLPPSMGQCLSTAWAWLQRVHPHAEQQQQLQPQQLAIRQLACLRCLVGTALLFEHVLWAMQLARSADKDATLDKGAAALKQAASACFDTFVRKDTMQNFFELLDSAMQAPTQIICTSGLQKVGCVPALRVQLGAALEPTASCLGSGPAC